MPGGVRSMRGEKQMIYKNVRFKANPFSYDLEFDDRITLVGGDSGTGKTVLYFKLLICCRWFILSATTIVNNCEIPDSSKSACNVFSLVVFRLATQKLSLKWLIDFSTLTLILYVLSHSLEPRSTPG